MAKLSELEAKAQAILDQVNKAKTEIVSKIAELQTALADVDIPEAAQEKLDALSTLAQALDDIVPDAPPTPS